MGPRVDLAFCGNGQLTESHESQFCSVPGRHHGPPGRPGTLRHFHKHLAGGVEMQCGRSTWYTGTVPCGHFCSQLLKPVLCARSTSSDVDRIHTGSTFSEFYPFHFSIKTPSNPAHIYTDHLQTPHTPPIP